MIDYGPERDLSRSVLGVHLIDISPEKIIFTLQFLMKQVYGWCLQLVSRSLAIN